MLKYFKYRHFISIERFIYFCQNSQFDMYVCGSRYGVDYGSYQNDPLVRLSQAPDDGDGGSGGKPKVDKRMRKDQSTHASAIAILQAGLGLGLGLGLGSGSGKTVAV